MHISVGVIACCLAASSSFSFLFGMLVGSLVGSVGTKPYAQASRYSKKIKGKKFFFFLVVVVHERIKNRLFFFIHPLKKNNKNEAHFYFFFKKKKTNEGKCQRLLHLKGKSLAAPLPSSRHTKIIAGLKHVGKNKNDQPAVNIGCCKMKRLNDEWRTISPPAAGQKHQMFLLKFFLFPSFSSNGSHRIRRQKNKNKTGIEARGMQGRARWRLQDYNKTFGRRNEL